MTTWKCNKCGKTWNQPDAPNVYIITRSCNNPLCGGVAKSIQHTVNRDDWLVDSVVTTEREAGDIKAGIFCFVGFCVGFGCLAIIMFGILNWGW